MISLSCKEVLEQLSDYIDGEGVVELRRAIEDHLARCHRCTVLLDTTQRTLSIVRDTQPFDVALPLDVSARLYTRLSAILAGDAR